MTISMFDNFYVMAAVP